MKRSWLLLLTLCCGVRAFGAEAPVKVLAAGSLTGAMNAVIRLYKEKTGAEVVADYGPAGLLLQRITGGEAVDLYASANMSHPRTLSDQGLALPPVVMARNRLCAKARPEFGLTSKNLLDRLLDPKVAVGTSTPKVDPGGDYAWLLFEKAGSVRPGATDTLKAKAKQLVGGSGKTPVPAGRNAMDYFFDEHEVDVFLTYCSSRGTTPDSRGTTPDAKYTTVEMPPDLAITADYGITVLTRGTADRQAALRFALFLLSPDAQQLISRYGFEPVGLPHGEL